MQRTGVWETDYKESLKETERNLSSMKYHLEEKMRKPFNRSSGFNGNRSGTFNANSPFSKSTVSSPVPSSSYLNANNRSLENNNNLISTLLKRIEEQGRTITHLNETIKIQSEDIFSLKEQMTDMENRLGSNKTNLINERKLEMFQREIRNEMESLMMQVRRHGSPALGINRSAGDYATKYQNDLTRDLTIQKRMIEEETDAVRREIDNLKTRIVKVETDSNVFSRDVQDCSRRCVVVERDLSNITDEHRRTKRNTDRKENDLMFIKEELQDISNIVNELQRRKEISLDGRSTNKFNKNETRSRHMNDHISSPRSSTTSKRRSKPRSKPPTSTIAVSSYFGTERDDEESLMITTALSLSSNEEEDSSDCLFLSDAEDDFKVNACGRREDGSILRIEELNLNASSANLKENDNGSLFGDYDEEDLDFLGDNDNGYDNVLNGESESLQDHVTSVKSSSISGLFHDDIESDLLDFEATDERKEPASNFHDDIHDIESDMLDFESARNTESGSKSGLFHDDLIGDDDFERFSEKDDSFHLDNSLNNDNLSDHGSQLSGFGNFSDNDDII